MDIFDFDSMYRRYSKDNKEFDMCCNLLNKLYIKDPITYNHCYRVGCMTGDFCMFLGYSDQIVKHIFTCAIMHDIGKLKISDEIMNKPGKSLTKEERRILTCHPLYGAEVIFEEGNISLYNIVPEIALHHESPLDDHGVFRINKENLASSIFILKTCDCFDAIRVKRRPDEIDKDLDKALHILNEKCFMNLTKKYIGLFNNYIKYIL